MEKLGLLYNDVIRYIKLSKWKTSQSAWCSLYTRNLSAKPSGATATKRPKKKNKTVHTIRCHICFTGI